ncbi:aldose 1-epimerase family protein [Mycobacterium avium subsp. avium 2285 (R)]|nr:aldose 1-epimerase family protein [Mycobacterium avium subsp. avium 2285 (R)]
MDVVALRDPVSSVVARFIPRAGMIGTSLRDGEVELLGQRRGLDAYVADGKTMGIPILYPWANRLGGNTYAAEGATVTLTPGRNGVRADPNGLPLHGVLAGYPGWRVTAQTANELTAQLDFGADPELLAGFPFPHLLQVAVRLAGRTLTLTTTVTATGDTAVPVCFGFHPYLQLPGVPRAEWVIETPPLRHLGLDDHGLPTGSPNYSRNGENRCGTRRSTTPTTGSTRARCSRCPAAGAGSRYVSSTDIPPRRSSRRRPNPARRPSSASSR